MNRAEFLKRASRHDIRSWRREGNAFSLVEILVAMAVFALLLVIVVQVTDSALRTWSGSDEKLKTFLTSRAVFETLSSDIENIVLASNLPVPASQGSGEFSFLTRREGLSASPDIRPLSFVRYFSQTTTTNAGLFREEFAYEWPDRQGFSNGVEPTTGPASAICDGVLSFQCAFSQPEGSSGFQQLYSGTAPPAAVRITMAVAGPRLYQQLRESGRLTTVQSELATRAASQSNSVLPSWNDWAASDAGKDFQGRIRFFERIFLIKADRHQ